MGWHGLDSYGSEQGQVVCSFGQGNELLGYVKFKEFCD
jgi:hypothetical protein